MAPTPTKKPWSESLSTIEANKQEPMDEGIQAHSPASNQTFRADTLADVPSRQRRESRERNFPIIATGPSTPSAASTSSVTLEGDLSSISGTVATRRGRRRGGRRGRARSVSSVATPTRELSALPTQSFQDHWQVNSPAADDGGFGYQPSIASTFAQASTLAVQQEPSSSTGLLHASSGDYSSQIWRPSDYLTPLPRPTPVPVSDPLQGSQFSNLQSIPIVSSGGNNPDHWQVNSPSAEDGGRGYQPNVACTFAQASTSAAQQEPASSTGLPHASSGDYSSQLWSPSDYLTLLPRPTPLPVSDPFQASQLSSLQSIPPASSSRGNPIEDVNIVIYFLDFAASTITPVITRIQASTRDGRVMLVCPYCLNYFRIQLQRDGGMVVYESDSNQSLDLLHMWTGCWHAVCSGCRNPSPQIFTGIIINVTRIFN